jgi:glycosyltransferase involved in cell wall biosynthesis
MSSKMRILFEGHTFSQDHGGISRMWKRIIPHLLDSSEEIDLALYLRLYRSRSAPQHPKLKRITHIEDTRIARLQPLFERLTGWRMKNWKPDIYQAMSYSLNPVRNAINVQCAYDCMHEAFPAVTGNPAFSPRKRAALETADHVIAISQATKDDLVEFFDLAPEKISVVHLAADELFFEPEADPEAREARLRRSGLRKPFFLFVGNRGNYKNFFTLLHAFAESGLAGEYDLVAVGGEPELRHTENEFVIKNRIETKVYFLPRVDDAELCDLYRGATAFIYPSLKEGFGIPILEAMAAGCPVIASDIPVFREIRAEEALMFDPHDASQLAASLRKCAGWSVAQRSESVSLGRSFAGDFGWERTANSVAEIYRSLLG